MHQFQKLAVPAALAGISLFLFACTERTESLKPPSTIPAYFVDADGSNPTTIKDTLRNRWPHLQFEDSAISINDRCPVRKVPLNRRLPALLVNGRPLGFC